MNDMSRYEVVEVTKGTLNEDPSPVTGSRWQFDNEQEARDHRYVRELENRVQDAWCSDPAAQGLELYEFQIWLDGSPLETAETDWEPQIDEAINKLQEMGYTLAEIARGLPEEGFNPDITPSTIGDTTLETFEDGSVWWTDTSYYTNDEGDPFFKTLDEFLAEVDDVESHTKYTGPRITVTGVLVHDRALADAPFLLTRMTRNGKPYMVRDTDRHSREYAEIRLMYTPDLLEHDMDLVTVEITEGTYTEQRATSRGGRYHVEVPLGHKPKLLKVHSDEELAEYPDPVDDEDLDDKE